MKTNYQLPELPYDYSELEPVISKEALEIHHKKHHQAYVDNLNKALDEYHVAEEKKDIEKMLVLESAISFNGGGHINHSFFWETLIGPNKKTEPEKEIIEAIEKEFSSFEAFKEKFNKLAVGVHGSGWAWLGYSKMENQLRIVTTYNHGTINGMGLIPLIITDVWEHAYYLQYQNRRKEFVEKIWEIFNWDMISKRYRAARA